MRKLLTFSISLVMLVSGFYSLATAQTTLTGAGGTKPKRSPTY
jgi:hypothetical protein